jgi:hypothetical protein
MLLSTKVFVGYPLGSKLLFVKATVFRDLTKRVFSITSNFSATPKKSLQFA